jgi:hypothetical protein
MVHPEEARRCQREGSWRAPVQTSRSRRSILRQLEHQDSQVEERRDSEAVGVGVRILRSVIDYAHRVVVHVHGHGNRRLPAYIINCFGYNRSVPNARLAPRALNPVEPRIFGGPWAKSAASDDASRCSGVWPDAHSRPEQTGAVRLFSSGECESGRSGTDLSGWRSGAWSERNGYRTRCRSSQFRR